MSEVDFLVGQTVIEVTDEGRIVFVDGTGPVPSLYAAVGDCLCSDANGESLQIERLAGRRVGATSTEAGTLTLSFRDGASLRCEPDERFEAWEVVGGYPQNFVVCMPGGKLAVWSD
jgi:hypothetical protein